MSDQPHYPYADGDIVVLGPHVHATADGETITWQGANYRRDRGTQPGGDTDIRKHEEATKYWFGAASERLAALARVRALAEVWQDAPDPLVRASAADLLSTLRGPQPPAPAHDAGPSVAEAKADDRRWWGGEKTGEQ